MAERNDPNYFRFAHIGWVIPISAGLTVLTWAYYDPEGIPWIFGPLGQLGTYLGKNYPTVIKNMFYVTFAMHVGEAVYSVKVCRNKNLSSSATMKWCFQTFLFGFASLLRLKNARKVKAS